MFFRKEKTNVDPFSIFSEWFQEATTAIPENPNAMAVATVTPDGQPTVRIVLLKEFSPKGFVFFTNYTSSKSQQLDINNKASLLFYWNTIKKQVRVEGTVQKVPHKVSEHYFHSRSRESQLGTHASLQSQKLDSHGTLEKRFFEFQKKFDKKTVPCPENWGGYILEPNYIEFWQNGYHRLHKRTIFTKIRQKNHNGEIEKRNTPDAPHQWKKERLFP